MTINSITNYPFEHDDMTKYHDILNTLKNWVKQKLQNLIQYEHTNELII